MYSKRQHLKSTGSTPDKPPQKIQKVDGLEGSKHPKSRKVLFLEPSSENSDVLVSMHTYSVHLVNKLDNLNLFLNLILITIVFYVMQTSSSNRSVWFELQLQSVMHTSFLNYAQSVAEEFKVHTA